MCRLGGLHVVGVGWVDDGAKERGTYRGPYAYSHAYLALLLPLSLRTPALVCCDFIHPLQAEQGTALVVWL